MFTIRSATNNPLDVIATCVSARHAAFAFTAYPQRLWYPAQLASTDDSCRVNKLGGDTVKRDRKRGNRAWHGWNDGINKFSLFFLSSNALPIYFIPRLLPLHVWATTEGIPFLRGFRWRFICGKVGGVGIKFNEVL